MFKKKQKKTMMSAKQPSGELKQSTGKQAVKLP